MPNLAQSLVSQKPRVLSPTKRKVLVQSGIVHLDRAWKEFDAASRSLAAMYAVLKCTPTKN